VIHPDDWSEISRPPLSVTVQPDVYGGEQPVAGKLRCANAETVTIGRTADDVGTVCVHFPRSGYRVNMG
jgi:glutathione S-transferase